MEGVRSETSTGGTSTDCALLSGSDVIIRRETNVGSLAVKAPSVDVRTVGAGGGSIAIYNDFTKQLRGKIQGVTSADVERVAKKWLDPKRLTIVDAGDMSKAK